MKILFLDMDGVLNSYPWFHRMKKEPLPEGVDEAVASLRANGCTKTSFPTFVTMVDPRAVQHLNSIISATGARVVISSSWRHHWTPAEMSAILRLRGFIGEVIDRTPRWARMPDGRSAERGHEIQEWLDNHPEVESFVILDDDSDMAHLKKFLVQTSTATGLLDKHVERAVLVLEGK